MTSAYINTALLTVTIIILVIILVRTKLLSKIVRILLPKPDTTMYDIEISRLKKIVDDCCSKENIYAGELDLYRMTERILNGGGWSWTMTKDPDEVIYTDGFARIFDVVPGQIITAKALMAIVHTDDKERVNYQLTDAFDNGEDYIIEYRIVRRNDRHDLIRCWGEVVKNEIGATVKVNGSVILLKQDVD